MTDLVITRIFDAPRELVYRAFTDPDQVSQWFGPVGWSVPRDTVEIDARPGGKQVFTMVNDDDPSMASPVDSTFVEVVENELLVGEEDVSHIPAFGAGKLRMRIEFFDEEGGRTRLVLTQSPFPAEMETGAREAWGTSFTKLDKLLA
ncbi:SRPBCC family protein [Actinoplanes siamensis]|uniref:Activator of HSP90 ATPase n=1 Tax=Actinoplanes siamensis TaxID=1223317 RepID=A0A919N258_9ACTN|nr:SRPBCC domain-containing protein [Actinoplanes siamensis]GIF03221.1 activator of HSP90 ATPase [Actinoplanes siamensis]